MLVKQKENKMKFTKIQDDLRWRETPRHYEVWEREDNDRVVITKTKGTKDYWVENLDTGNSYTAGSLKESKEIGYTL